MSRVDLESKLNAPKRAVENCLSRMVINRKIGRGGLMGAYEYWIPEEKRKPARRGRPPGKKNGSGLEQRMRFPLGPDPEATRFMIDDLGSLKIAAAGTGLTLTADEFAALRQFIDRSAALWGEEG